MIQFACDKDTEGVVGSLDWRRHEKTGTRKEVRSMRLYPAVDGISGDGEKQIYFRHIGEIVW